jgi:hypothetical protein
MKLLAQRNRRVALAFALGALSLLASCGGGDPIVAFEPTRVLAFGDENSLITPDGRKYTINSLATADDGTKTIDCKLGAIWLQRLASKFGLVFPECNPDGVVDPRSRIYAAVGAKAVDLVTQVDQHLADDSFSAKDLVTLFVGQHDVLAAYAQYPTQPRDVVLEQARAAGLVLAGQVKRIADAGGKVLVSTAPDLGYSPFALAENVSTGDAGRAALIADLVAKFNEGLRLGIAGESGTEVALMLTDELIQVMVKFPASYAMVDVKTAACDEALAATVDLCTTDTLVSGATATNHLWADDTHISVGGHVYLGSLAVTRATGNPF